MISNPLQVLKQDFVDSLNGINHSITNENKALYFDYNFALEALIATYNGINIECN